MSSASKMPRIQRFSSRSDLFPRLVAMQKLVDAQNFAVFRVGAVGAGKQRILLELDNLGAPRAADAFVDAYGDALIEHLDNPCCRCSGTALTKAALPKQLTWCPSPSRLRPKVLPYSGVAFPVRLGAVGNGYVVFTANYLDLSSGLIVELHGRSCQIMMDLLALDEKRSPAAEALSDREIACLQLAGDGRISEEIAERAEALGAHCQRLSRLRDDQARQRQPHPGDRQGDPARLII